MARRPVRRLRRTRVGVHVMEPAVLVAVSWRRGPIERMEYGTAGGSDGSLAMLFVGFAFIRGSDWGFRGAFALAIAEAALYALGKFYFGDISPSKLSDNDHFLWEISMSQSWFMPGAAIGALLLLLTIGFAAL